MSEPGLRIEYWELSKIKKHPANPKKHDEPEIARSIYRFGFLVPAIVDETTGLLAAGHGRADVLLDAHSQNKEPPAGIQVTESGEWAMPVIRGVAFSDESELEAFLVAANQTTIAGGWDDERLANVLVGLRNEGEFKLDGTGYTAAMVDQLVRQVTENAGGIEADEYQDFSDLDRQLEELDGYQEVDIRITVPAMHETQVTEWLANGEVLTSPGMGKGVLRRCGLL